MYGMFGSPSLHGVLARVVHARVPTLLGLLLGHSSLVSDQLDPPLLPLLLACGRTCSYIR